MNARSPSADGSPLLTLAEARTHIGVSYTTFRTLLLAGDVPVVRLGPRTIRVSRRSLDTLIAEREGAWQRDTAGAR